MKPPACVSCKWGTGTTCEKTTNSVNRKELEDKLKEMQAMRSKQDEKWFAVPTESNAHKELLVSSSEPLQNKRK